jgi:hypothetical protein
LCLTGNVILWLIWISMINTINMQAYNQYFKADNDDVPLYCRHVKSVCLFVYV